MQRLHKRFIERDFMFEHIRKSTEYLTNDQINTVLDEHSWDDLTFIFTIDGGRLKYTIIIDNNTECDRALADLNRNSRKFYEQQVRELTSVKSIEWIKNILYKKVV